MLDRDLFVNSAAELVEMHAERLRRLIGTRIERSWVAWDVKDDVWFADEAVILDFGGQRLEVVCFQLSLIALTWGQIDVGIRPAFVAEWNQFELEWRQDALGPLRAAVGSIVQSIDVVEYRVRTTVVAVRGEPDSAGGAVETRALHGVELRHERGVLVIFNALDQNGLADETFSGNEFRRWRV